MNFQKQTQTKPNLSAYAADKFALSLPNGPIKNTYVAGKIALSDLSRRSLGEDRSRRAYRILQKVAGLKPKSLL